MKQLDSETIRKLAHGAGVKRMAAENFLMTVHNNPDVLTAEANLFKDALLYSWNSYTVRAIKKGIEISGSDQ